MLNILTVHISLYFREKKRIPDMGESSAVTNPESKRCSYFLCLFNNCDILRQMHSPFSRHANRSLKCVILAFDKCLKYVCVFIYLLVSHETIGPRFHSFNDTFSNCSFDFILSIEIFYVIIFQDRLKFVCSKLLSFICL